MNTWHMVLYALAAFLALRSLVSLMTHHKREFKRELIAREEKRMQRELDKATKLAEAEAEKAEAEKAESEQASETAA